MAKGNYWHGIRRGRIPRRRFLVGAGTGAAGLTLLAASRGGKAQMAGSKQPGLAGQPEYGGRFRTTATANIDSFDPHVSVFAGLVAPRVYNPLLIRSAADASFAFDDLAQSLEQPDETTWIFSIRPGVKIAPNGLGIPERDLDSQDAFVTFDRIRGLPQSPANLFVSTWFDQHETPDAATYVVRTPSPYAYFLERIGSGFTTIPPRELIQENPDHIRQNAVGGGPFFLASSGPAAGESIRLDKNTNYSRTDSARGGGRLPYVDGWDIKVITDRAARRLAFTSQQSYAYTAQDLGEANELLGQYGVYVVREPVFTFISFVMNAKRPPWNDPRIRKAAMYAMNQQQYIDLVYSGEAKANGLVHWPLGRFALSEEELQQLQPFDAAQARQLIREATGQDTVSVRVMYPAITSIEEHDSHLPIFLEQMRAAGFDVEQDAHDFASWLNDYLNKDYDATLAVNQIYETPEIPLDFQHSNGPAGNSTYSNGLQNAAIDDAIDRARTLIDPTELVNAVLDVQRQIYQEGPACLPIVSPYRHTLYWNFVRNIPEGLGSAGQFLSDLWLQTTPVTPPSATPSRTPTVTPTRAPTRTPTPTPTGLVGDVDCDHDVTSIDAALVLQNVAQLITSLPCQQNADVNRDGRVNAIDATIILQYDAGLLPGLPV